jgi:hypothetical protein
MKKMMMMTMKMKMRIDNKENNLPRKKFNKIRLQKILLIDVPIIKQLIWEELIIYLKINQLSIIPKNSVKVHKTVKLSHYLVQIDRLAALTMSTNRFKIHKNNNMVQEVQGLQVLCLELGNFKLVVDMDFNLLD